MHSIVRSDGIFIKQKWFLINAICITFYSSKNPEKSFYFLQKYSAAQETCFKNIKINPKLFNASVYNIYYMIYYFYSCTANIVSLFLTQQGDMYVCHKVIWRGLCMLNQLCSLCLHSLGSHAIQTDSLLLLSKEEE